MKQTRELYRPSPKTVDNIHMRTYEDIAGSEVYTYECNGKPCAMAFAGRRSKPDWRFRFRDDQQREYRVHKWLEGLRERETQKTERQKQRTQPHGFRPGQLFYISWGYDQTNIDYYMLTETRGKTQGYVVPISQKTVRSSTGADYVAPDPNVIRQWDALLGISKENAERGKWKRLKAVTDYGSAWSCDGRYFASPCDAETERYQTAAGWGH